MFSSRRILLSADSIGSIIVAILPLRHYLKENVLPPFKQPGNFLTRLITVFCLSFLLIACGQSEPKPRGFTIGIINPNSGTQDMTRGFIEGLADQGYVAGKNTTFITAFDENAFDQMLQKMVKKDVDLIFSVTTPATKKAIKAAKGKDIPVVFAVHDPVRSGIMKSLLANGKNVTGIQIKGSIPKALDWLLTLSPDIDTVLVPVHFDTPATKQSLDDLRKAAQTKNINLVVREINRVEDIAKIFQDLPEEVDAVFLVHSIFISSHTDKIVKEAGRHRLPVGGGISTYRQGALITFGVNHIEVGRQASRLAQQILQGAETKNIPVETADFYLGINLETARSAGITVSDTILSYADDIIPLKDSGSKDVKLNTQ
jgi:putative ABC transport system substrate-binding protein